jgi:cobalamin biosynthesis Mg chelatase CobN
VGYVRDMTPGHDPDRIDPTNQSGRPVMVTGAIVGIILAVLLMLVVYLLAR